MPVGAIGSVAAPYVGSPAANREASPAPSWRLARTVGDYRLQQEIAWVCHCGGRT
jgi:hypothetical protein